MNRNDVSAPKTIAALLPSPFTLLFYGEKMIPFEVMMNPEKYGYKQCDHCNGYGSSMKDPFGVDKCTKCGGSGLEKKKDK